MFVDFPKELRDLKRWVGCTDKSKVPLVCVPTQDEVTEYASSTNSETWQTYGEATLGLGLGYIDYMGFVFNEQDGYVGIDIDCGQDEFGNISELAKDIIHKCCSYTEISKSGKGYHIILKGNLPFLGRNNKNGVEIYKGGRYFVMTGKNCFYYNIIENQSAIDYVVEKYFPEYRPQKENDTPKLDRIYSANYKKPKKGRISLQPIYPEIKKGSRNVSLLSLAGQFKVQGMTKGETYRELLKINHSVCKPPLGTWEVENIIESVWKYK